MAMSPETAACVARNLALYVRLRDGDPAARDELIDCNMPLVKHKAGKFVSKFQSAQNVFDELVSEGYLGLVRAVDGLKKRKKDTALPTAYISRSIEHSIREGYYESSMIRVPPKKRRAGVSPPTWRQGLAV